MEYGATLLWTRRGAAFGDSRYSRAHVWEFDGGATVPASSSPHSVPLPCSDAAAVDPEEAFVAALASCHMLFFLALAAKRGYTIETYRDSPVGVMEKDAATGRMGIATVTLRPDATFGRDGLAPAEDAVHELHDMAHHACFLANSVRTQIVTKPTFAVASGE